MHFYFQTEKTGKRKTLKRSFKKKRRSERNLNKS